MKQIHFSFRRCLLTAIVVPGILFLLSSCGNSGGINILFADFDDDNIGAAPAEVQTVGTVSDNSVPAVVKIVESPGTGATASKWASIPHPAEGPEVALTGKFSRSYTSGKYGIVAALYIPYQVQGKVRVQLQSATAVNFFHLDFQVHPVDALGHGFGDVLVNGHDNMRFGQFVYNKSFVLTMELKITATAMTMDISIAGGGTTGHQVVTIPESLRTAVEQFSSVNFGVNYDQKTTLFVDDIIVTHFDN
jgi:hypothetical protein